VAISNNSLVFQVGANQGQTIQVDGVDTRGSQLGEESFTGNSFLQGDLTGFTDDFELNGTAVAMAGVTTGEGVVDAINLVSATSGVTARQASSTSVDTGAYTAPAAATPETITINGVDITFAALADIDAATTAINDVSTQTGVTASNAAGTITFSNTSGADMTISQDAEGAGNNGDIFAGLDSAAAIAAGTAMSETYTAGITLSTDVDGAITVTGTDAAVADAYARTDISNLVVKM